MGKCVNVLGEHIQSGLKQSSRSKSNFQVCTPSFWQITSLHFHMYYNSVKKQTFISIQDAGTIYNYIKQIILLENAAFR